MSMADCALYSQRDAAVDVDVKRRTERIAPWEPVLFQRPGGMLRHSTYSRLNRLFSPKLMCIGGLPVRTYENATYTAMYPGET